MALAIPIVSEFDGKGVERAIREFQQLEGVGAKAQFALKKAALPAAAAIGGLAIVLGDATKAAMEDAAAQAQLALDLRNVTGASNSAIASAENWIATQSLATGIADDQLRPALAALVRGTKDVAEAQNTLGIAMDISTATGADLTTVSEALAKAYQGNMKGLRALSPEMATMIKEGATLEEVLNVLGGTFGGATATQAATAAGQMQRLGVALSEAKETIGAALLPALEAILPPLVAFGKWAGENPKLFLAIAAAVGAVAGAVLALNAAMKVYHAAQIAVNVVTAIFNALMAMNPVGLVVLAIGALIAALVLAYNKIGWFRDAVDAVFRFIGDAIRTSVETIGNFFSGVFGFYKSLFNRIAELWNSTVGKLRFEIPDWVPVIGGKGFDVPDIPMLAAGGIVTEPTLAMIGEAGPEAVIPLNRGAGFGTSYTVNVNGGLGTGAEIGEAVVNAIRQFTQVHGPAMIDVA